MVMTVANNGRGMRTMNRLVITIQIGNKKTTSRDIQMNTNKKITSRDIRMDSNKKITGRDIQMNSNKKTTTITIEHHRSIHKWNNHLRMTMAGEIATLRIEQQRPIKT